MFGVWIVALLGCVHSLSEGVILENSDSAAGALGHKEDAALFPFDIQRGRKRQMEAPKKPSPDIKDADDDDDFVFDRIERDLRTTMLRTSSNRTVVSIMRLAGNTPKDLQNLILVLIVNTVVLILIVLGFTLLRLVHPILYCYRALDWHDNTVRDTNSTPGGCCGWLPLLLTLTEKQAMECSGLDGVMMFRYARLCQKIVWVVALLSVTVLCPTHYFLGVDDPEGDIIFRISIDALLVQQDDRKNSYASSNRPWWIHVCMVWIVVLACLHQIGIEHRSFLELRFQWLQRLRRPQATTLLIENIPMELCSDAALREYFASLFGAEAIEKVHLVRRTRHLQDLVQARDDALEVYQQAMRELQSRHQSGGDGRGDEVERQRQLTMLRTMCMPKPRESDRIQRLADNVKKCQHDVDAERVAVEAKVLTKDCSLGGVCSRAAFVTFASRRAYRLASREQFKTDAREIATSFPPPPEDVNYDNVAKDATLGMSERVLFGLCVFLIFVIWLPLVALVAAVLDPDVLMSLRPVSQMCTANPVICKFMQSQLAALALRLSMLGMPFALMHGIRRFCSPRSGNEAQLRLQRWYYVFLVIFVLLITAISSSFWRTLRQLVNSPRAVFPMLADAIPLKSHWYTEYLLIGWVADASELIRIKFLTKYTFWLPLVGKEEAKRRAEVDDQFWIGIGGRMGRCALNMTIVLTLAGCFPLIAVAGCILFRVTSLVQIYLVVFAENKYADCGGEFWSEGLQCILVALTLYVVLMTGLLAENSTWQASLTAFGALLPLYGFYLFLQSLVWERLPFETVAEMDKAEYGAAEDGDQSAAAYVQKECLEGPSDLEARNVAGTRS
eukprot:TRINITY_DN122138_c0_g1_i1.p1 TRINITY_DN122138_c0_g1~~TRINITY_DN122138_c0_g1_i1.p1  ORF type:complete len:842 (-),score=165.05 TRINITY_DN122138_c0_g1_i1:67-2592(-)